MRGRKGGAQAYIKHICMFEHWVCLNVSPFTEGWRGRRGRDTQRMPQREKKRAIREAGRVLIRNLCNLTSMNILSCPSCIQMTERLGDRGGGGGGGGGHCREQVCCPGIVIIIAVISYS